VPGPHAEDAGPAAPCSNAAQTHAPIPAYRLTWARLLARGFRVDVTVCPAWGGNPRARRREGRPCTGPADNICPPASRSAAFPGRNHPIRVPATSSRPTRRPTAYPPDRFQRHGTRPAGHRRPCPLLNNPFNLPIRPPQTLPHCSIAPLFFLSARSRHRRHTRARRGMRALRRTPSTRFTQ
jgi:hypothetical protein